MAYAVEWGRAGCGRGRGAVSGVVSGVVCQFWIVGNVHSSLVPRIKSLRTPNKSVLGPEVNDWLGLAQTGG